MINIHVHYLISVYDDAGLEPLGIPKSASNPISLNPTLQKDMYPSSNRSEEKPNPTSSSGKIYFN